MSCFSFVEFDSSNPIQLCGFGEGEGGGGGGREGFAFDFLVEEAGWRDGGVGVAGCSSRLTFGGGWRRGKRRERESGLDVFFVGGLEER